MELFPQEQEMSWTVNMIDIHLKKSGTQKIFIILIYSVVGHRVLFQESGFLKWGSDLAEK